MRSITTYKIKDFGKLCCDLSERIYANRNKINSILDKSEKFNGLLGSTSLITQKNEVDEMYNQNISFEEKQAWVFYKQSLGIPMHGWEEYFISKNQSVSDLVYATNDGTLLDNYFRKIGNFIKGTLIGKFIKKSNHGEKGDFIICRNQSGIVIVPSTNVKVEHNALKIDESKLKDLVMKKALIYCNGEYLPYPVYAYTNIYDSQLQLEKDKEYIVSNFGQDIYQYYYEITHQEQSITYPHGAKPKFYSCSHPDTNERLKLSPISNFATDTDLFSINTVREEFIRLSEVEDVTKQNGQVKVRKKKDRIILDFEEGQKYSLQTVFKKYLFALPESDFQEITAVDIVDYYLENKKLVDDSKTPDEKRLLKSYSKIEGEKLFQRFLYEVLTHEDQQKLDFTWNRIYNAVSPLRYDKVPIMFSVSKLFKGKELQLKKMQREVLGYLEISGSGIVSLDVGGGKTMCLIISLAMGLSQGKFKRPLLVLPKPVYQQFINEMQGYNDRNGNFIEGVLTGTNIKINAWDNLSSKKFKDDIITFLKNGLANKQVEAGTITVITKEGLNKLGFSDSFFNETFFYELSKMIIGSGSLEDRDYVKKIEKFKSQIGVAVSNTIFDFDTLGFDAIYADEAHKYRNVFDGVPSEEGKPKKYYLQGSSSAVARKMFYFAHLVQKKYGNNVILATATPFQKAILDIFGMLSIVGLQKLAKYNIFNLTDFCDMFVKTQMEYSANLYGKIELREVVKTFVNSNILRNIVSSLVYYRDKKSFTNVKLPCKISLPLLNVENEYGRIEPLPKEKQILTYLKMTDAQQENQKHISNMFANAEGAKLEQKSLMIFQALNLSQNNAFTSWGILGNGEPENYIDFINEAPKAKACCLVIKSLKEKYGKKMPGQIIYSNRHKDYFPYIREFLIRKCGFEVDEIKEVLSETPNKTLIQNKFNSGEIKILIGTSTIVEGLNLQENATDIHVINSEWNPTNLVQLAGRIHRQGNKHGYIRFITYLLQDSEDVHQYQKCEEKISRLNEILQRNGNNVIDATEIDAEEIKYSLITDIDALAKMDYDQEIKQLQHDIKKQKENLQLLKDVQVFIKDYKDQKEYVISTIINCYDNFNISQHIKHYYNNYKNDEKQREKILAKNDAIANKVNIINQLSDIELIKLCKEILTFYRTIEYRYWTRDFKYSINYSEDDYKFYSKFIEIVSKIKKAEITILKPKGFDRNSNLDEIIETTEAELADFINKNHAYYYSDDNDYKKSLAYQNIVEKIENIKNQLKVSGSTPEEVARNIAKTNYLLDYTIDNRPCVGSCCIPPNKEDNKNVFNNPRLNISNLLLKELELLDIKEVVDYDKVISILFNYIKNNDNRLVIMIQRKDNTFSFEQKQSQFNRDVNIYLYKIGDKLDDKTKELINNSLSTLFEKFTAYIDAENENVNLNAINDKTKLMLIKQNARLRALKLIKKVNLIK